MPDALAAADAYLEGGKPPETNSYNNGVVDVPAAPSEIVTVDKRNVKEAIIDAGYWNASDLLDFPRHINNKKGIVLACPSLFLYNDKKRFCTCVGRKLLLFE